VPGPCFFFRASGRPIWPGPNVHLYIYRTELSSPPTMSRSTVMIPQPKQYARDQIATLRHRSNDSAPTPTSVFTSSGARAYAAATDIVGERPNHAEGPKQPFERRYTQRRRIQTHRLIAYQRSEQREPYPWWMVAQPRCIRTGEESLVFQPSFLHGVSTRTIDVNSQRPRAIVCPLNNATDAGRR
jgi:hypothetical protein